MSSVWCRAIDDFTFPAFQIGRRYVSITLALHATERPLTLCPQVSGCHCTMLSPTNRQTRW